MLQAAKYLIYDFSFTFSFFFIWSKLNWPPFHLSRIFACEQNDGQGWNFYLKYSEIHNVKKLHIPTVSLCIFIRIWMYTLICFGVSSSILDHLKSIVLVKMNINFLIYLEITFNYLYLVWIYFCWSEWSDPGSNDAAPPWIGSKEHTLDGKPNFKSISFLQECISFKNITSLLFLNKT